MKRRVEIVCMLVLGVLLASCAFAGEMLNGGSVVTLSDGVTFVGMPIKNPNESFQSKFRVDGGFISIPNDGFSFEDGKLWKIVNIDNRDPSEEEKKIVVVFKGKDFDVTFNEKGDFSSDLTSFEKTIGEKVEEKFNVFTNLSDRICIEMVAKEVNLPPIIVSMIHSKAALLTGGRLGVSKEQSTNENKIDPGIAEQNKAFGKLKFGDSPEIVLQKLQEDESLSVNYYHGTFINASFKVGNDRFYMEPEFYQEKLYQIRIRTRYDYWGSSFLDGDEYSGTIESGWKSLIKLISNSYGSADSTKDVWLPPSEFTLTHEWHLNKKRISILVGPRAAMCFITDVEMEQKVEKEKEQKENELFSDKSKYF